MKHSLSRYEHYFIPNIGTLILIALLLFAYRASAAPGSSPATPDVTPGSISYQCLLTDATGKPITGNTDITFSLYATPTGGSALWTEAHIGANAVPVSNGLCHVLLGSLTPISGTVWNNANVYLGVKVGNDAEMSPREVIGDVPISKMAWSVPDGAIGASQIADGAITSTKIVAGAIGSTQLAANSVGTTQIADGAAKSRDIQLTTGNVRAVIPSTSLSLLTTFQDVPGTSLTLTPDTAQKYAIYVTADLETNNGLALAQLFVDGNAQLGQAIFSSGPYQERGTVSQVYLVSLAPGNHSVVLKAEKITGSAVIWEQHTQLTYFAVAQ